MQTISKSPPPKLSNPWVYFGLTFAWTWAFWFLAASLDIGMDTAAGIIMLFLGVLGPMVTGITFTYPTQDKAGQRDYWLRIVDVRRINWRWYLVIFLSIPFLNIVAALVDGFLDGSGATWGEALQNFTTQPFGIVLSILFASLIPLIEELGWRGYVLDRMQAKWNALTSSLILGVVWALWHLPLFFIKDTYQSNLGVWSPAIWLFMVSIIPLTIVMTWVYNNTQRSTLAAILLHSMVNFTGELIAISVRADGYASVLWFLVAIGIVLLWGPKTFMGKKNTSINAVAEP